MLLQLCARFSQLFYQFRSLFMRRGDFSLQLILFFHEPRVGRWLHAHQSKQSTATRGRNRGACAPRIVKLLLRLNREYTLLLLLPLLVMQLLRLSERGCSGWLLLLDKRGQTRSVSTRRCCWR